MSDKLRILEQELVDEKILTQKLETAFKFTAKILGEMEKECDQLRELFDIACELWARETTGLGSKLDRFAVMNKFQNLGISYLEKHPPKEREVPK